MVKARSRQYQGNVQAMLRQCHGKVKVRSRQGSGQVDGKVKARKNHFNIPIPNLNYHEYMKENAIGQPLFRGPHLSFSFWQPLVWASVPFGTYQMG